MKKSKKLKDPKMPCMQKIQQWLRKLKSCKKKAPATPAPMPSPEIEAATPVSRVMVPLGPSGDQLANSAVKAVTLNNGTVVWWKCDLLVYCEMDI